MRYTLSSASYVKITQERCDREREREIDNILFTQVQYKVFTCPGQFEHRAPGQPLYSLSSLILREEELPRAFF